MSVNRHRIRTELSAVDDAERGHGGSGLSHALRAQQRRQRHRRERRDQRRREEQVDERKPGLFGSRRTSSSHSPPGTLFGTFANFRQSKLTVAAGSSGYRRRFYNVKRLRSS